MMCCLLTIKIIFNIPVNTLNQCQQIDIIIKSSSATALNGKVSCYISYLASALSMARVWLGEDRNLTFNKCFTTNPWSQIFFVLVFPFAVECIPTEFDLIL